MGRAINTLDFHSRLAQSRGKRRRAASRTKSIRQAAGVTESEAALHGDHMGLATFGWVSGCATIWSSLFAIGNFLYGRTRPALLLTGAFVVSGLVLLNVIGRLWSKTPARSSSVPDEANVHP